MSVRSRSIAARRLTWQFNGTWQVVTAAARSALRQKFGGRRVFLRRERLRSRKETLIAQEEEEGPSVARLLTLGKLISAQAGGQRASRGRRRAESGGKERR